MKLNLKLEKLTCANCAGKIEKRVNSLPFVKEASMDFANQKLFIEYENDEKEHVLMVVKKIVKDLEPKVIVKPIIDSKAAKSKEKNKEEHSKEHEHSHTHSHDHSDDESEEDEKAEAKESIRAVILSVILLIIALVLDHTNLISDSIWSNNIMLLMYALSYIICGKEVIQNSINNLKTGDIFDENFLMLIATIGAFFIGEYFEGALVMIFYKAGETASDMAVTDSRKSIKSLLDLKVTSANLKTPDGYKEVDVEDVEVGDILIVKPGEKIPVDSVVVKGNSLIDTSSITGESVPRCMNPGDKIFSGSINKSTVLEIKVEKNYSNSEVSKMIELIENSTSKKTNTEKFITKFARIYTPVVVLVALALAIIPSLINGSIEIDYVYKALSFLVVSCPCALVLSVPLGYFAGIGSLSKEGILLKGTNIFEDVCKTNYIAFDKTGTLTKGDFEVQDFIVDENNKLDKITNEEIIKYAYVAEYNSNHPVAEAIKKYAKEKGLAKYDEKIVKEVSEKSGMGMQLQIIEDENGTKKERTFLIGNEKLLNDNKVEFNASNKIGTILYVAIDNNYVGYFLIADTIKEDSKEAIEKLKAIGVNNIMMLTGDNDDIARSVAEELKVPEVHSKLMPNEKVEIVKKVRDDKNNIMFVGDGMNDAPVMTVASSSVAMGKLGSDVSVEAADIIIMDDNIKKVSKLILTAKKVRQVVMQNIVFAIGVKLLVLLLITLGYTNMLIAVLSDVGVTLIAVLNSVRILKY